MDQTKYKNNKNDEKKSNKPSDPYAEVNANSFSQCLKILNDNYKKKVSFKKS